MYAKKIKFHCHLTQKITFFATSGSMAGGQNVTVSGTGFTADSTNVTVCGNPALILEAQPTEMIIQTPSNDGNLLIIVKFYP